MNFSHPLTIRRIAMIEAAIKNKPLTACEIAKEICICHQSALSYIRVLLGDNPKRGKHIRVASWRDITPHNRVALYRWGGGRNVPKPKRMTKAEAQRRFRAKIKSDKVENEIFLARNRAKDYVKRVAARKQNPFSALGL